MTGDSNHKQAGNQPEKTPTIVDKNKDAQTEVQNHPLKRLLKFQLKLAAEAIRDILLSPVSLVATLADLIFKAPGQQSYFEKLMRFGRRSDAHINLFEHHNEKYTIDAAVEQVEKVVMRAYQDGELSAKAKTAIEKRLKQSAEKRDEE